MILPNQTGNLHQLFRKRITELAPTRELSLLQLNVGAIVMMIFNTELN